MPSQIFRLPLLEDSCIRLVSITIPSPSIGGESVPGFWFRNNKHKIDQRPHGDHNHQSQKAQHGHGHVSGETLLVWEVFQNLHTRIRLFAGEGHEEYGEYVQQKDRCQGREKSSQNEQGPNPLGPNSQSFSL